MKKIILSILAVTVTTIVAMAQDITKPSVKSPTAFAIVIDKTSYDKTKAAVDAYRQCVEADGLGTYLAVADWQKPEQIRQLLEQWHVDSRQPLEGCVFIGDIPIPMVRDAQYLSSAFKMSQKRDWKESSVPSDRYYDDFSLKFDFLKRDADRSDYFYYSLSPDGSQTISPDIYSARIRPPHRAGQDRYQLLSDYLEKVVRVRKAEAGKNMLDRLTMARGHGYNSEDANAWSGEQLALREQMPQLFLPGASAKFFSFEMVYPARKLYLNEVQDDRLDVMLFHHHGAPDTQYLNGYPNVSTVEPSLNNVKRFLRSKVERAARKAPRDSAVADYARRYGVPEEWCREAFDSALIVKDSIFNAEMDIHVEDLLGIKPSARFVLFDACFNGSFYEDDCIANAYIFNQGNTIATMGNTVNTIQDKWPDEFVGLLASGMRVGQFNRYSCYLETHIVGDPTYRFASNSGIDFDINLALTLHSRDAKFWKKQLDSPIADVQAMALRQLHLARYANLPRLLNEKYFSSQQFVVRMEALKLLALYYPDESAKVLCAALDDGYELIRRLALGYVEDNGNPDILPALVSGYINRWQEARYLFKALEALIAFHPDSVRAEVKRQAAQLTTYDNKFISKLNYQANRWAEDYDESHKMMFDRTLKPNKRLSNILKMRNYPNGRLVPDLLKLVADESESSEVRATAANVLGWLTSWHDRQSIVTTLSTITTADSDVNREIRRTLKRLQ